MKNNELIVGVDASRNRSGGAVEHVKNIVSEFTSGKYGIRELHIWAYSELIDSIPDVPGVIKHKPPQLEGSLFSQIIWQAFILTSECKKERCDILFSTDASTFCRFNPMVVLSQDMLSYETGVMSYFSGLARLRLIAILFLQNNALRNSEGVIFLTKYAGEVIQGSCGKLNNIAYIPHGVENNFREHAFNKQLHLNDGKIIRCLYVSPVWEFKHQWVVVRAVEVLRDKGYNIVLDLVGGGSKPAIEMLEQQIHLSDPKGVFVTYHREISHYDLPIRMSEADLFVFASSCENLPITLLEAMSVGLPIACSERGPMKEVLEDGGVYFDPEDASSIASAVERLVVDTALRESVSERASKLSEKYSWQQCADETWTFIANTSHSLLGTS